MASAIISGSGLFTPKDSVTNEELVASQVAAAEDFNRRNAAAIAAGAVEERICSSEEFIVKASGIEHRYVVDKRGTLDPQRMHPILPLRSDDDISIQCEMAVSAIREALGEARREPEEVDAVIVACSNLQRPYPAVAVEVQHCLGADGWAYDLNVACASAAFGLQNAVQAVEAGSARCAVVVSPEITSGHNNFELRDSHFIFGDACTALVVERGEDTRSDTGFEVLSTELHTRFSNNIRNNFGFLNRSECWEGQARPAFDLLFRQNGRKVFKEVCPTVVEHLRKHLAREDLEPGELKRIWLHQANRGMNQLIARNLLGREVDEAQVPSVLSEYANTSSAGSVIAFHKYKNDLISGDLGMLCAFGAGYSVGSALLRRA